VGIPRCIDDVSQLPHLEFFLYLGSNRGEVTPRDVPHIEENGFSIYYSAKLILYCVIGIHSFHSCPFPLERASLLVLGEIHGKRENPRTGENKLIQFTARWRMLAPG
jgi:hypothetical protein